MHFSAVANLLGKLLLVVGLAQLVPVVYSALSGEAAAVPMLGAALVTCLAGGIPVVLTPSPADVSLRTGYAVVGLGWVSASFFGALPFILTGALPNVVDAAYETMSGFTTTGASVITDVEVLPRGLLLWRSLTQWLGGMGIIVLFIAVLPRLGASAYQLFKAEVPGPVAERVKPRISETAQILWLTYVFITALQVVALGLAGVPLFDSVNHAFTTMATGGFSVKNSSVGAYGPAAHYIVAVFMILAGANFALYYQLAFRDIRAVARDTELRVYLLLLAVATLLVAANLLRGGAGLEQSFREALFQVVSIMTTTGFATADFARWSDFAHTVLLVLMFVGGCAGSTAGGIKVARVLVLSAHSAVMVKKAIHPRAVLPLRVGDRLLPADVVQITLQFFFLFVAAAVAGTLVLTALGMPLLDAFSAVAANLGNVGPGLGSVGPMVNYAGVPVLGKVVLYWLMLLGRLELYTILVMFQPEFWRR